MGVSYRKGVVSVAHTCLCRREKDLLEHPILQQVAVESGKTLNQVQPSLQCLEEVAAYTDSYPQLQGHHHSIRKYDCAGIPPVISRALRGRGVVLLMLCQTHQERLQARICVKVVFESTVWVYELS